MKQCLPMFFSFARFCAHITKRWIQALTCIIASAVCAEEGMWPFNHLPLKQIQEKYGVELSQDWIDHVQKASLRISAGGSGSFVSAQGLILTNHHVGATAIYNLSQQGKDLMKEGFLAPLLEDELPVPDFYADQLISIRDITDEIKQATESKPTDEEKEYARKAAMARIKETAQQQTGLQPEIVALYQGAIYNLYLYRRYTDIRLVMAPEKSIAFFGGDEANFEYPRYDLDCCFFRIYDNGEPLATPHYFKLSATGPTPDEPLFVSGNPGTTKRMLTSAHVQFVRKFNIDFLRKWLKKSRAALTAFGTQSPEHRRIAQDELFSIENAQKVVDNLHKSFKQLPIIADKRQFENQLQKQYGKAPWNNLQKALKGARSYYPEYTVLEGAASHYSQLYSWAKQLVRYAVESEKPNDQRLKEFAQTEIPTLKLQLLSTVPVYPSLDQVELEDSFARTISVLGKRHPVSKLLKANSPSDLLAHTKLMDLSVREHLFNNPKLIEQSTDPLLVLAKSIDPYARAVRKRKEIELDSVQNESYSQIAKILFARYGQSVYPDATFTLRLSIGTMKGYEQNDKQVVPQTQLEGLFATAEQHHFTPPYDLPPSWISNKASLDMTTPFNFVSTNDIIGGNSGSPVINQNKELVGLIFDGNIESIIWSFAYSDVQGRATSVHSRAILEALQNVYHSSRLIQELQEPLND